MDHETFPHTPPDHRQPAHLISRRSVVQAGLVAPSLWLLSRGGAMPAAAAVDTRFEGWRPWLLSSAGQVRPRSIPRFDPAELAELRDFQERRTAETMASVEFWDDPTIIMPWTNLTLELIKTRRPSPVRAGRALALLHTALFDTLLATADARRHSDRPHPATVDPGIIPLGQVASRGGSFPSEHAAVAAAAATVLTYLFPDDGARDLAALTELSRLWAGQAVRSDLEAGQAIGYAVGQRAVARGLNDQSNLTWDGAGPPGEPGAWEPTPPRYVELPADPTAGRWRPWVLPNGAAFRPSPPPPYRSPAWRAEVGAVRFAVTHRTRAQADAAYFWAGGPGTVTPGGLWIEIARDMIRDDDLSPLSAARVMALTSVAMFDAFICCWDAIYAYWMARPITADPSLNVLIPTPPFPSYTSGHSTISTAAATVLGYLFPAREAELAARAAEARNSRLWAGIHFAIDNEMGAVGGAMLGRLVMGRDAVRTI
jgi:membrane-associated phospholipid phosphatase